MHADIGNIGKGYHLLISVIIYLKYITLPEFTPGF